MAKESGGTSPSSSDDGGPEAHNWVQCDKCNKWRQIPRVLAKLLGDDVPWYCEHNPNPAFNSCSIAQELTDAQIDAENNGSEADEDERETSKRKKMPAVWQLLKENTLGHRKRKAQDEDDIMICHCKPTWRGGDGCGPDCLNRVLCIECVPGFCPCEHKCTNQMFTNKQYAGLEVKRAGAKGFGLFATKPIVAGQFIIEYIGEVLEEEEYVRRKEFYLEVGQRHYYFMNVGNGEVIDACRKGNISRFINHSCEPNCETQKWLVKGELAIGLFSLKDIALGEELTFDYNFERYGDKPMKCFCASRICRKFIGGGGQDGSFQEDAVIEYHDTAMYDIEPLMVVDAELDGTVRTLLDWRVGAHTGLDGALQATVLARLEKLCKSHGNSWTKSEFSATAASLVFEQQQHQANALLQQKHQQQLKDSHRPAKTTAVKAETSQVGRPSKAKLAANAAASAATAAAAVAASKALPAEEQVPAPILEKSASTPILTRPASVSEFKGPLKAAFKQSKLPKQEPVTIKVEPPPLVKSSASDTSLPPAAPDTEAAAAATPAAATSAAAKPATSASATPTPPIRRPKNKDAQPKPLPKESPVIRAGGDQDWDSIEPSALEPSSTEVSAEVSDGSEVHEVIPMGPVVRQAVSTQAAVAPAQQPQQQEAASNATRPAQVVSSAINGHTASSVAPIVRKASTTQLQSLSRSKAAVPVAQPAPTAAAFKKRSEIDRRLDGLVAASGRLKDNSKQNIIKVLRMFNLCDIGPPRVSVRQPADRLVAASQARSQQPQWQQESPAHNSETPQRLHQSSAVRPDATAISADSPAPFPTPSHNPSAPCSPSFPPQLHQSLDVTTQHHGGQEAAPNGFHSSSSAAAADAAQQAFEQAQPGSSGYGYVDSSAGSAAPVASTVVTARTKARLADLSLLLDVLLKCSSSVVKRDFVACGVLSQIQQVVGRNFGREYAVILRKVCKVVESLPLTADDLHATRSAHGSFADVLRALTTNADFDVRNKAALLLRKFPSSAVSDLSLIRSGPGMNGRSMGNNHPHMPPQQYRDPNQQPATPIGANGASRFPPPQTNGYTNGYGPPRSLRPVRPYNASPAGETPSRASPHATSQPWSSHAEPDASNSNWDAPDTSAPFRNDYYPASNGATPSGFSLPPGLPRSRIGRPTMRAMSLRETADLQTPGKPSPARQDAPPTPSGAGSDSPSLAWATATAAAAAAAAASADGSLPAPKRRRRSFTDGPDAASPSLATNIPQPDSAPTRNGPPPILPLGAHAMPNPAPSPHYHPSHTPLDLYAHNNHQHHSHSSGYASAQYQQYAPPYSHHHQHQQQHYGHNSYHQVSDNAWDSMHHNQQQQHYYQGQHQQHYQEQQQHRAPPKAPNSSPPPLPVDDIPPESPPPPPPLPVPPHALLSAEELFMLRICVPLWSNSSKPCYPAQPTAFKRNLETAHGSDTSSPSFYGEPTSIMDLFSLGIYGGHFATAADDTCATVLEDAMDLDADDNETRPAPVSRWQPGPGMSPILGPADFSPVHQPEGEDLDGDVSVEQQASADVNASASAPFGAGNLRVTDLRSMAVVGSGADDSMMEQNHAGLQGTSQDPSPSDATALLHVTAHRVSHGGQKGDAEDLTSVGHQAINSNDWNRPVNPQHHPESWERPDISFEAYVGEAVRHRLGKYVLPDHPNRISSDVANSLHRKVQREVVEKEIRAFEARQQQAQSRPIERKKLEANLKEFVRQSIRKLHQGQH